MRTLALLTFLFASTSPLVAQDTSSPPLAEFSEIFTADDQDATTTTFGRIYIDPYEFHLGIWRDVADCLRQAPPRGAPWHIYWAVADSIKSPQGFWAYGVTEVREGASQGVVIEERFWFNSTVVSHEIVHVLSGAMDHEGPEWGCVMPSGSELPLRRVGDPR